MENKLNIVIGEKPSKAWNLNNQDLMKILKGALIAFGAAFIISVADWVALGVFDWVLFKTICLPAAVSVGLNALVKWMQGQ